jgi:hypothetical protein
LVEIADIQRNDAFFGEIVEDIRAAEVAGQATAKKGVGKFFGPVMRREVVLDC